MNWPTLVALVVCMALVFIHLMLGDNAGAGPFIAAGLVISALLKPNAK